MSNLAPDPVLTGQAAKPPMAREIFLIRHGQSTFNEQFEATGVDPLHFDAPLSRLGLCQVRDARPAAATLGVELVVTSPLTRALQTAVLLFEGGALPVVVSSLHRERLGNSCDVGRNPAVLMKEFPALGFDHLEEVWWHDGEKDERGVPVEPEPLFHGRVEQFVQWIGARPERAVAVIGHGTFFHRLTGRHLANCEILNWRPEP